MSANGEAGLSVTDRQRVRAGKRVRLDDGSSYVLLDKIRQAGGTVLDDGLVRMAGADDPAPFLWAIDRIPNPEDYVLARSDLLLEEIYDAGEWEALGPRLAPPDAMDVSGADSSHASPFVGGLLSSARRRPACIGENVKAAEAALTN